MPPTTAYELLKKGIPLYVLPAASTGAKELTLRLVDTATRRPRNSRRVASLYAWVLCWPAEKSLIIYVKGEKKEAHQYV